MKKLAMIGLAVGISLTACKKDEEEKSDYQGSWNFKSEEQQMDTTLAITINASGAFSYKLNYQGMNADLSGSVDDNGKIDGKVTASGISFGSMKGTLKTSGTGSGNYYLLSDTISWTATRK